jgi:hypothetical protein
VTDLDVEQCRNRFVIGSDEIHMALIPKLLDVLRILADPQNTIRPGWRPCIVASGFRVSIQWLGQKGSRITSYRNRSCRLRNGKSAGKSAGSM